jgi:NhaP-type Na+/H+ or K+/H+ antiporter
MSAFRCGVLAIALIALGIAVPSFLTHAGEPTEISMLIAFMAIALLAATDPRVAPSDASDDTGSSR